MDPRSGGKNNMVMKRVLYAGAITLVASVGIASSANADTGVNFRFKYDKSYGDNGLSQPYAGPTTTGQSYGTGVAIQASDTSQKVYSLVEANANIGVGGARGAFPAAS